MELKFKSSLNQDKIYFNHSNGVILLLFHELDSGS